MMMRGKCCFRKTRAWPLDVLSGIVCLSWKRAMPVLEANKNHMSQALTLFHIAAPITAAAIAAWHSWKIYLAHRSTRWAKTEGLMLACYSEIPDQIDNPDRYEITVEYTYKVGYQLFKSNQLTFRPVTRLKIHEVNRLLAGIKDMDKVDVYYNPDVHSQSVLIPGISWSNLWRLLFWLAFAAFVFIATIPEHKTYLGV
jgi:Protein of unknown function (DUF3592)